MDVIHTNLHTTLNIHVLLKSANEFVFSYIYRRVEDIIYRIVNAQSDALTMVSSLPTLDLHKLIIRALLLPFCRNMLQSGQF